VQLPYGFKIKVVEIMIIMELHTLIVINSWFIVIHCKHVMTAVHVYLFSLNIMKV